MGKIRRVLLASYGGGHVQSLIPLAHGLRQLPGIELEVIGFTTAVAEKIDHAASRWLHFGLTSSDVGDTAFAVQMVQSADLLIAECGDGPTPNALSPHMSGGEAGGIAARAKVKQLLLTHCFPEHDRDATIAAARAACPSIPVEWAIQGRLYPV